MAHAAQPVGESPEIALHERLHKGVGAGRARALVFADLRSDLGRNAHGNAGQLLVQDFARATLVDGIAVGVHEADRDRFDPVARQRAGNLAQPSFVERQEPLAAGVDPLAHFVAQMARHDRGRTLERQIIEVVARLVAHLEDVAEALGRDEADLGALALDDGVGHQRGAVDDAVELDDRPACLAQQALRAGDDGVARIA